MAGLVSESQRELVEIWKPKVDEVVNPWIGEQS